MRLSILILLLNICFGKVLAQNNLIVHEWGTFTTLVSSDGKQYTSPLLSLEKIPEFVYNQYYKYYDNSAKDGRYEQARLLGANMGMETPVLYFYSDKRQSFELSVQFKNGTITQFFPNPTSTESFISPVRDFHLDKHTGFATWKGIIHDRSTMDSTSFSDLEVNAIWRHPREVESNLVEVKGEKEKYLFYRGLANYTCPIIVENDLQKEVKISNTLDETLPFYICTEIVDGKFQVHAYGSIVAGNCIKFNRSVNLDVDAKELMVQALVAQGLYEDEAKAMIATWNESYFNSSGLKVFWIVPNSIINELLPLNMNPEPRELKRAFFGRIEVMEAEFEKSIQKLNPDIASYKQQLTQLGNGDPYKEQRVLLVADSIANHTIPEKIEPCFNNLSLAGDFNFNFIAFPNPVSSEVFIQTNFKLNSVSKVRISDQMGKVISEKYITEQDLNNELISLDINNTPAGIYLIQVYFAGGVLTKKLLIK